MNVFGAAAWWSSSHTGTNTAAAYLACMGNSLSPKIQPFKGFKSQWSFIDTHEYKDASGDEGLHPHLAEVKESLKTSITDHLKESHPQDFLVNSWR